MNDPNPYLSPNEHTEPTPAPQPTTPRLSIKAVVVGWLVDIGISLCASVVLGIGMAIIMISNGMSPERMAETMSQSIPLNLAGIVIGALSTVFGAYVAAWIAKQGEIRQAMGVAVLSTLSSLLFLPLVFNQQPIWVTAVGYSLIFPAALLGGYLRKNKTVRTTAISAENSP